MKLKAVMFVAVVLLATLRFTSEASATYQVGWWRKASGSAQILADQNHIWAAGYDAYGQYLGNLFDFWLDGYCQLNIVNSGNNMGAPLRIQFSAPYGSVEGCLGVGDGAQNFWGQFYGWTNGLGYYSGQNFYSYWYVIEYESYVFPRDPNSFNSRGTTLEIY